MVHRGYVVGGPARVGKSSLAHRLLRSDGIAWLPTDVLRTVLRRVLPEVDELDQGDVSAASSAITSAATSADAVEASRERSRAG